MKIFLVALTVVFFPLISFSNDFGGAKEKCEAIADLAGSIMELRQLGEQMSSQIEDGTDGIHKMKNHIVVKAYKMPKFPESMRREVVSDFKNEIFLECYQENSK